MHRSNQILVVILPLLMLSCAGRLDPAWRATAAVRAAADLTDRTIAEAARQQHEKCLARHGSGADLYRQCISAYHKALSEWTRYTKPAIDSALIATVTALTLAEKAKDPDPNWVALLKPAACAVVAVVARWRHLSVDLDRVLGKYLPLVKGVCHGV